MKRRERPSRDSLAGGLAPSGFWLTRPQDRCTSSRHCLTRSGLKPEASLSKASCPPLRAHPPRPEKPRRGQLAPPESKRRTATHLDRVATRPTRGRAMVGDATPLPDRALDGCWLDDVDGDGHTDWVFTTIFSTSSRRQSDLPAAAGHARLLRPAHRVRRSCASPSPSGLVRRRQVYSAVVILRKHAWLPSREPLRQSALHTEGMPPGLPL